MKPDRQRETQSGVDPDERRAIGWVVVCGVTQMAVLAVIFLIAGPFAYESEKAAPVVVVTALLIGVTVVSLLAVRLALAVRQSQRSLVWILVLFALGFRALMIAAPPILEIDYYRYLWDGRVANAGISPYRFSPAQVLEGTTSPDEDFQRVVALSAESESVHTILKRIHFKEYKTIYPPVSQTVFSWTIKLIPGQASVEAHVAWLRGVLVLFDIGTLLVLLALLVSTKTHPAWLAIYAWNPLVIKEIANSGHLDSVAVFFVTLTMLFVVRLIRRDEVESKQHRSMLLAVGAAVSLGLGVGSKLFPVVLFPAVLIAVSRRGWKTATLFGIVCIVVSTLAVWPMAVENPQVKRWVDSAGGSDVEADTKPTAGQSMEESGKEALAGFLSRWRMNDMVFGPIYYNVRPNVPRDVDRPWYVVVPEAMREGLIGAFGSGAESASATAFLVARSLTLAIFGLVYLFVLLRLRRADSVELLEQLFLLLALFLLLQPTVNPWYWTWVMPLVCFARNRGWLWVSGFLLIYYFRFWFQTLAGEFSLGGYSYSGAGLFDHGLVWVEFAGIVVALLWGRVKLRRER